MWSLECEPGLQFTALPDGAWRSLALITLEHKPLQGEEVNQKQPNRFSQVGLAHTPPAKHWSFIPQDFRFTAHTYINLQRISLEVQSREAK